MTAKQFMARNGVSRLIMVNSNDEVVLDEQRETLPWEGLFTSLFGSPERISNLRSSLAGQILPQTWSQGDLDVYVSVLASGDLIGLFRRSSEDAVSRYRTAKRLVAEAEGLAYD